MEMVSPFANFEVYQCKCTYWWLSETCKTCRGSYNMLKKTNCSNFEFNQNVLNENPHFSCFFLLFFCLNGRELLLNISKPIRVIPQLQRVWPSNHAYFWKNSIIFLQKIPLFSMAWNQDQIWQKLPFIFQSTTWLTKRFANDSAPWFTPHHRRPVDGSRVA